MEKQKYDLKKYTDMCVESEVTGADGTVVKVRDHIPYWQKEEMATYLAEHMLMVHDDSCVYLSHTYEKNMKYMVAKYYTDIDTDDVTEDDVADFLVNNNLWNRIVETAWDDIDEVSEIFDRLKDSVIKTYEDDKCLTKALRTSFGFLFTGEDISESIAQAEAAKDTIYEAVNALRNLEKEKSEKIDHGKLALGGNIINFAKKTE